MNGQDGTKKGRERSPFGKPEGTPPKKNNRIYWIYGIMAVSLLLLTSIRWGGGLKEITWLEFEREMFMQYHVEQVVLVNGKKVEVFIRKEHLQDSIHAVKHGVHIQGFNDAPNPGPHYQLPIVSPEQFDRRMEDLQVKLILRDTTGLWDSLVQADSLVARTVYNERIEKIRAAVNVPVKVEERREWGRELGWLITIGDDHCGLGFPDAYDG
jgi:hypothetical protein